MAKSILALSEADVAEVLAYNDLIPLMARTLVTFSDGKALQPVRQMLPVEPEARYLGIMPAVLPEAMGKVENLIRPIALNRKNVLFAGHDEGGRAWGIIASLIETAKINGVEPFAYLKETLQAIARGHTQDRLDELLPWNFNAST